MELESAWKDDREPYNDSCACLQLYNLISLVDQMHLSQLANCDNIEMQFAVTELNTVGWLFSCAQAFA